MWWIFKSRKMNEFLKRKFDKNVEKMATLCESLIMNGSRNKRLKAWDWGEIKEWNEWYVECGCKPRGGRCHWSSTIRKRVVNVSIFVCPNSIDRTRVNTNAGWKRLLDCSFVCWNFIFYNIQLYICISELPFIRFHTNYIFCLSLFLPYLYPIYRIFFF